MALRMSNWISMPEYVYVAGYALLQRVRCKSFQTTFFSVYASTAIALDGTLSASSLRACPLARS